MIQMIEGDTIMTVTDYPQAIEANQIALHAAGEDLAAKREQLADRENEIRLEVLLARDENGKVRHPNEATREAVIHANLAADDEYQQQLAETVAAERKKVEISARLERLRSQFKLALIDYEADRLGRRTAA